MTNVNCISTNYAELLNQQDVKSNTSDDDIIIPFNSKSPSSATNTSNAILSQNSMVMEAQIKAMVDSLVLEASHIDDSASNKSIELLQKRLELIQNMSCGNVDVSSLLNKALNNLPDNMMKKACEALGVDKPDATDIETQNYSPVTSFQKAVSNLPKPIQSVVDKTTNAVSSALSNATAPNVNAEGATESGAQLAQVANETAKSMGSHGWCLKGVNNSLEKMYGFRLSYPSAYMAADGLRARSDQFKEVSATKDDLANLPAGAIVVWDKDSDNPHGHISISLGNGYEASDHIAKQYTNISDNFTVFIPQDV